MSAAEHAVDCKLEINAPDQASLEVVSTSSTRRSRRGTYAGRPALDKATDSRIRAALNATDKGTQLFESLLPAKSRLLKGYYAALSLARPDRLLRLRLRVVEAAPSWLHALPWELLHDPEESITWSCSSDMAFSRFPQVPKPEGEPVEETPRLLVAIAEPSDLAEYSLPASGRDAAETAIRKALAPLNGKVSWEIFAGRLTAAALSDRLREGKFHALHLQAHGLVNDEQVACVVLEKEDGTMDRVKEAAFGQIFEGLSELRLVTLIACHGGAEPRELPLSGLGPGLIGRGVPAVLAMRKEISFDAAQMFSEYFYRYLADYGVVDRAANVARHQLRQERPGDDEWSTPILFMQLAEGRLWASELERQVKLEREEEQREAERRKRDPLRDGLLELLEKVERHVKKSLAGRTASRRLDVAMEWDDRSLEESDEGLRPLGPGGLAEVFDNHNHLLILGDEGSGKSVALEQLALDLIKNFNRSADELPRVPVRFNLAHWRSTDTDLTGWLVGELDKLVRIGRPRCQKYLDEERLVPLLDGLDEVALADRATCVKAIQSYLQDPGGPLVVTCRTKDYEELGYPLHANLKTDVFLRPVGQESADRYLAEADPELPDAVRRDKSLSELAGAPLWLKLMADTYEKAAPDELEKLAASPSQELPRHLVSAWAKRRKVQMEKRKQGQPSSLPYEPDFTFRHLAWLARRMKSQSMKLFRLDLLQPLWLPPAVRWLYAILTHAATGGLLALPLALSSYPHLLCLLPAGLVAGALAGVVDAVAGALTDVVDKLSVRRSPTGDQPSTEMLERTLRAFVITAVSFGAFLQLSTCIETPLVMSLLLGQVFGLVFGTRPGELGKVTRFLERLKLGWSWKAGLAGALVGALWVAGTAGLVQLLPTPAGPKLLVGFWVVLGALFAMVGFFLGGGIGGLKVSLRERTPSLGEVGKGIGIAAAFTVPAGLVVGYVVAKGWGLLFGAVSGFVIAAIRFGGLDLFQLWTTRTLLSVSGRFPRRWVYFLNHAVNSRLLLRSEAGYEFLHDVVRDYFSELHEEKKETK